MQTKKPRRAGLFRGGAVEGRGCPGCRPARPALYPAPMPPPLPPLPPLPIDPVIPDLLRVLDEGGAAVLQAPPGAGKTTRVPLALLDRPWLAGRRIAVLEPRRLAARAAAARMAATLGEEGGGTVGYRGGLGNRGGARPRGWMVGRGRFPPPAPK